MTSSTQNNFADKKQKISFSAVHFGSDLLCAAWALVISSLLYYIATAINISRLQFLDTRDILIVNDIVLFISSIAYTIAAIMVLTVSYEEPLRKLIRDVSVVDIKMLTFVDLYFTGNVLLVTSWLVFLGTLPLVIFPIWGMTTGYTSVFNGLSYLIFLVFLLVSFYGVVVVTFPENLSKIIHAGSSCYFLDYLQAHCSCCGDNSLLAYYFMSDYIFSLWLVYLAAVAGTVMSIYIVVKHSLLITWLGLFSSFFFAVGSYLYAIDSYTPLGQSSHLYDFFCCVPNAAKSTIHQNDQFSTNQNERIPLVSHNDDD